MMNYETIPGLENYGISRQGVVWSFSSNKKLSQNTDRGGYRVVSLVQLSGQGNKPYLVHRLLALTYISNPRKLYTVNHKDGNKLNNDLDNLEWMSLKDNVLHSYANGLQPSRKGEMHGHPKLTNEKVKLIRKMKGTQREIAVFFKVDQSTISLVKNRKGWSHV